MSVRGSTNGCFNSSIYLRGDMMINYSTSIGLMIAAQYRMVSIPYRAYIYGSTYRAYIYIMDWYLVLIFAAIGGLRLPTRRKMMFSIA